MHVIREYQPEDTQQVEACFVELQDFLHRLEPIVLPGKAAGKYFDYMIARCAETSGKVFVVEVDGRVVGFVCVWAKVPSEELDEKPVDYAFISDLVVLPTHRGQGLGHSLLQRAEEYVRSQGATTLELQVLAKNENALRVYNRYGFRPYHLLFKKSLG